jgi:hypothetical protein
MLEKLKSRKFLLALVTGLLVVLNDGLDLGIDSNTVITFAALVGSYIFGEAYVDGKRAASSSTITSILGESLATLEPVKSETDVETK